MARQYSRPDLPDGADVRDLVPVDADTRTLTPKTRVTCINRGVETLLVQHNGHHYEIAPGLFEVAYATARHIQQRLIVPGTRQRTVSQRGVIRATSYIGILGVDAPEACEPFTVAELNAFGVKHEGLDRESMPTRRDREVTQVSTKAVRGKTRGQAATQRRQFDSQADEQGSDEAAERARNTFTPPARSDAERDERELTGAGR